MHSPDFLAVHIMKTAGTSLRGMLSDGFGAANIYPNTQHLTRLPHGWYPGPAELVEHVRSGKAGEPRLVIGHVPFVLTDEFAERPVTIALLRDPVARAVSMLEHRRKRAKQLREASYDELLADERIIDTQVRDYQTKTFAFDTVAECPESVNVAMPIDDARFGRALERLEEVDVLGVVEQLPVFTRQLEARTGITLGEEQTANRGSYERDALPPHVRCRLEALTAHDTVLYRRALEIIAARDEELRRQEEQRRAADRATRKFGPLQVPRAAARRLRARLRAWQGAH